MRTPRPYQVDAVQMLRQSLSRSRRRPVVRFPTGGGKTLLAAMIIHSARAKNTGARVLFIVDAITLVDQTVEAFHSEGIYDVGVIQADHVMTNGSRLIQVASVQTLQRRGMPPADIVFVDECHRQNKWLIKTMASEQWAHVPFIGLSATPWAKGMAQTYDDLICPISMQELIDQGYLCPFKVFAAAHPDLTGVRIEKGDYATGQLSDVMSDGDLVADIVKTWQAKGENRPTLVFCVDRAHAAKVQQRFQAAGIGCGYIDAFTESAERKAIRAQLDAGEIKVVANVACLTTGVDWAIGCVVLARPTKSEMLYVQMVGRGLRVNDGIPDCIILDHADNTLRMGFVTDIHHSTLCDGKKAERKAPERKEALPKECPSCTFLKPPKVRECPACGFTPSRVSELEERAGELVEIKRGDLKASKAVKQSWLSQLNAIAANRGYKRGWAAQTYRKRFGCWPRGLNEYAVATPTQEVKNFVLGMTIRYSLRKAA